ncbi:MAG: hypothetical protein EA395_13950 [Phormidium sp. GEM2.Bin31]|nr:hypothetical protein [Phormidium sp. BM_Day4_Bin.17]TVR06696.1 MAG: hypothetical protein EA395_13950 [Phormidium sp. GEM2.Bin31]UCJ14016.1 MAG: hypothetical protein JWS08_09985 [Phormidium sp. PBR-2020]
MLIPGALGEILVSARTTGKLTVLDRHGLKAAILDESLSEEEQRSIDRLLRAVVKGRISVDPLRPASTAQEPVHPLDSGSTWIA